MRRLSFDCSVNEEVNQDIFGLTCSAASAPQLGVGPEADAALTDPIVLQNLNLDPLEALTDFVT